MGMATLSLILGVALMGGLGSSPGAQLAQAAYASLQQASAGCPTTEHVVVARTARMYVEPDANAAGFGLADGEEFDVKTASQSLGIPFRYVATRGDWYEVDSCGEDHGGCLCQGPHGVLSDFSLRLFVRQEAVLEVVTREVEGTDAAGLKYRIRAGAQVEQVGGLRRPVGLPASLAVPLPDDAVGKRFVPQAFPEIARSEDSVEYILCHDNTLHRQAERGKDACGSYRSTLAVRVTVSEENKPLRAVAVQELGCVRIEGEYAVAPPDKAAILKKHPSMMTLIGVVADSGEGEAPGDAFAGSAAAGVYAVKAGAKVWWPTGKTAGSVATRHDFRVPPDITGERSCFTAVADCSWAAAFSGALGSSDDDDCGDPARHEHLELCFDPQDVEKK